ncbi:MAG: hypothetical protein GYA53_07285, partial [Acidobacteria bacterium]|nr:hypothetical protein [Acidobacteriota bacterium]
MDEKDQSQASLKSRREFLKIGLAGTAGLWLTARDHDLKAQTRPPADYGPLFSTGPLETVKVGFVGVGGMGSAHVQNYLNIDGVEIKAICDIVEEKVAR